MTFKTYPKKRYVSGTYKRICDNCGFDFLRSELVKQYNNFIVCMRCKDPRSRLERPRHRRKTKVLRFE